MSSEVTFEEIVELKIDNRGKTPPIVPAGHPLVEVNALVNCGLHPDISKVSKFVDDETWETWFRQHLQKDDIVFSTVGTIGETAIVANSPDYGIAQNILGFRFKKDLVSPLYMLYLMRSDWFINQVTGRTIETVQKSIKWSDMRGIKLFLPPVPTQEKIAKILGDLDRKIELNRRMNETLEQIGKTVFKQYFIDNPESENWDCLSIEDLADVQYGFAFKSAAFNENDEGTKIARIRNVLEGDSSSYTSEEAHDNYVVNNGDLLVGMDGEFHIGYWSGGKAFLVQRVANFKARKGFSNAFVKYVITDPIQKLNKRGARTTVAHLSAKDIREIKFPFNSEVYESISGVFGGINQQQIHLLVQNRTLAQLRDSILPKLISGQVTA